MLYLRAAGLRATDKCADVFPACPVSISSSGVPSMRTKKKMPEDVMITHPRGATDAANKPLHAVDAGEKFKHFRYDSFKADCRAAGIMDACLSMPMRPLLFETFGAAGREVLDLMRHARRHFTLARTSRRREKILPRYFPRR